MAKQRIFFDEKVKIFKRYFDTVGKSEELTGNTVFEGYPIGQWAIQIRHDVKHKTRDYPETLLEELSDLGVLERQRGLIDEEIDALAKWADRYPGIKISVSTDRSVLEYIEKHQIKGKDREELLEKYRQMQQYLGYIKSRHYRHKLTKQQLDALKNANLDESFGYSDEIEKLSTKYRIKPSTIKYLVYKYGSMESFISRFKEGTLKEDQYYFKDFVNIDHENSNEDNLARAVLGEFGNANGHVLRTYSGKALREALERLVPRERAVIDLRYGLEDGKPKEMPDLEKEFQLTRERIRQIEAKGLRKLRYPSILKRIFIENQEMMDVVYQSNAIINPDPEFEDIPTDLDFDALKQIIEKEAKEKADVDAKLDGLSQDEQKELMKDKSIDGLDLSVRAYNCLRRAGIKTIGDLLALTREEISQIRNLNDRCAEQIINSLANHGLQLKEDEEKTEPIEAAQEDSTPKSKEELLLDSDIDILDLSVRSFNCIRRTGIITISDLLKLTREELSHIRNLSGKCVEEIISKLANHGLQLKEDEEKTEPIEEAQEDSTLKSDNELTDLEKARAKRDELRIYLEKLETQVEGAKKLLEEYDKLFGDEKTNPDNGSPDFKND